MARCVVRRDRSGDRAAERDVSLWDALGLGSDRPDWRAEALCAQVDPDLWFPERGGAVSAAQRICRGCPVRVECLADALVNGERFGIWGGLSEPERRRLVGQGAAVSGPAAVA